MESISFIEHYLGIFTWPLLLLSSTILGLLAYIIDCRRKSRKVPNWCIVFLYHFREMAVTCGLLGTVYALICSFDIGGGATAKEVQARMFHVMSTGLWSTFVGSIIAIQGAVGLMILKRI